jgi:23S rRNA (adenine2503-C2)-methyltransferase
LSAALTNVEGARPTGQVNLLGLSEEGLVEFFEHIAERPFRARQIMRWVYQRGERDFSAMTDLSAVLRRRLQEFATLAVPPVVTEQTSADGTHKWLFDVGSGQAIESVFIPEPRRGTLCISSQAGCALDCAFCATGAQGFNRNLSAAEILGQVVYASGRLGPPRPITNVVFMGMGEPLANYREVLTVARVLTNDHAYGLSRRRVTISTAGLVPQIHRLAADCNVALAVSLHAPDDELRDRLVPINRIHPIAELLAACWVYAEGQASRQITFEYVMLAGVNDTPPHARRLARLLRNRPAKVNLIPFNVFPGTEFTCSSPAAVQSFWQALRDEGLLATVRRPRGDDIAAACGQLAGRVSDRRKTRLADKHPGARS